MKLSALKEQVAQDEEGLTFAIVDPHGDPYTASDGSESTFTVVGTQSKARRKAEDAEARRLLKAGRAQMEPEDIRERRVRLVTACVIGHAGWEDDDGQPIAFSAASTREVLLADERILAQVEQRINEHSAFLSKRSTSSSAT